FDVICMILPKLQIGVCNNRGRIIPHHHIPQDRTRPFWKPSAFLVSIYQPFLHLGIEFGVHQVKEREKGSEGVPESCIREHVSGKDFTVIRTEMDYFIIFVDLIEFPWKKKATIEAGVKSFYLIVGATFHFYSAEFLIPFIPSFLFYGLKISGTRLFQIQQRLVVADKRRSDTGVHNFAF